MAEQDTTEKTVSSTPPEIEAGISAEQLSYICEYCGKVNSIEAGKCVRCGKRRPRSEYIKAVNKAKEARSVREKYVEDVTQREVERKEAEEMRIVRLVEERVAEEKAHMKALETIRMEQDCDSIRRVAAREAAIRVIEAEKQAREAIEAAEKQAREAIEATEKQAQATVDEAERRAREAIDVHSRENEEMLRQERDKILYRASQKIVSDRQAVEDAAEEKVRAECTAFREKTEQRYRAAIDEIEKDIARRAVMKVVAAEQSADDRVRLGRAATERAVMERIDEEVRRASGYEVARSIMEKEGMRKAADDRIRAERELFMKERENAAAPACPNDNAAAPQSGVAQQTVIVQQAAAKEDDKKDIDERIRAEREMLMRSIGTGVNGSAWQNGYAVPAPSGISQQPVTVQPIAIVPYLNDKQPVMQYNPNRIVYRFVPDPPEPEQPVAPCAETVEEPVCCQKKCAKKKKKVSALGVLIAVFAAVTLALAFIPGLKFAELSSVIGTLKGSNLAVVADLAKVSDVKSLLSASGMIPVTFALTAVFAVIALVQGLVRAIGRKAAKGGWVIGLLFFLFAVATYVLGYFAAKSFVLLPCLIPVVCAALCLLFAACGECNRK